MTSGYLHEYNAGMVNLQLDEVVAQRLQDRALQQGLSLEAFLRALATGYLPADPMSPNEFEEVKDKLATPCGGRPPDVSRADMRQRQRSTHLVSKSGNIQILSDDLPLEQFEDELDKVAMSGAGLPKDFSREDIYFDHD